MECGEIFVICDFLSPYDSEHVLQVITKAKLLSEKAKVKVSVICIGKYIMEQFDCMIEYGADTVLYYERLSEFERSEVCNILSDIIQSRRPEVILFLASDIGKELAASLSTRFESGLTADCIDIELNEENEFCFSRAAINNSVIAKIKCVNSEIKMCTIKEGAFIKKKCTEECIGNIEVLEVAKSRNRKGSLIDVLDIIKDKKQTMVDISKASVVFCIGRGVKSEKTLETLYKLAKKCNAEIIGTRAAVEEQLVKKERQVGQSGKNISPQIYVGFGVSGASQHMVGIKNANIIIAINNDPNAPIFNYADYAIVEDLNSIVYEVDSLINTAAKSLR